MSIFYSISWYFVKCSTSTEKCEIKWMSVFGSRLLDVHCTVNEFNRKSDRNIKANQIQSKQIIAMNKIPKNSPDNWKSLQCIFLYVLCESKIMSAREQIPYVILWSLNQTTRALEKYIQWNGSINYIGLVSQFRMLSLFLAHFSFVIIVNDCFLLIIGWIKSSSKRIPS